MPPLRRRHSAPNVWRRHATTCAPRLAQESSALIWGGGDFMGIALLIPCHNAASSWAEVLNGAREQTEPFDEITCYDDGSTDGTTDVARSLGANVIRAERNRGAGFGRSCLLHNTRCEFVHIHDSDDPIFPWFLADI